MTRQLLLAVPSTLGLLAGALAELPKPADLPKQDQFPDPLVRLDGTKVTTADAWQARRTELKELFQHYMYGRYPTAKPKISALIRHEDRQAFGGKATLQEIELDLGMAKAAPIHLLLMIPNQRSAPAPVFVGMNFCGNHCLTTDPKIRIPTAWIYDRQPGVKNNRASEAGRGKAMDTWPLERAAELAFTALGSIVCWLPGLTQEGADKKAVAAAIDLPSVCETKLKSPEISWQLWEDVEGRLRQKNLNVVQRASDLFAWQDFIALNWPAASERGEPARSRPFTAAGVRLWETWKETSEVYLLDGAQPPEWNAPEPMPADLRGQTPGKILHRQNKIDEFLRDDLQPTIADGTLPGTLTDQRGKVVRYEIRMNRVLFDYVVQHELYHAKSQAQVESIRIPNGAMLVKAAWREVTEDEAPRFYTVEAYVADRPDREKAKYHRRKVGLVGLHIMHKTASAPQWIWSTFEQIDNVSGAHPSFHNPRQRDGEVNRQTHSGTPNQVTRVIPIPALDPDCGKMDQAVDNVQQLNRDVQKALGDSVFRHYELIGTQWPVSTQRNEVAPSTVFQVLPELLGNTTMETFIQETSSCMGCHAMARTSKTSQFVSADFTFTLGEAFPRLPNLQQIPAPSQREAGVPKERWARVVRGYELAARTYELLPDFVPHAKLHCQSCHLNAGGNPTAAWWVGMMAKFRYPETDQLPARINQCFEQSMNGKPLCDARDRTDPNMNALIVYMQWLDEQATVRKIPMPAQPFPALSTMSGNAERGKKIFLQKCAFCHGNDGQGRYLSDTYYRPALWGKHSFNARAGMAKPATFAAFIHGNMPFGSGGELTAQEAWDIASFVDAQERPEGKRQ